MLWELLLLLLFAVLSHSWPCSPEKSSSRLTLTTYYNLLLCIMTILLKPTNRSVAPLHLRVPCALFFCASCSELLAAFQNLDCRAHSLSSERLVCTERRSMGNTTVPETRGNNNACAVVVVILKALSLSPRIEQSPSSSIQKNATGNSNISYFQHMVYFIPMHMVQSTRRMEFRKIGTYAVLRTEGVKLSL